jgi:hypothetical protein
MNESIILRDKLKINPKMDPISGTHPNSRNPKPRYMASPESITIPRFAIRK